MSKKSKLSTNPYFEDLYTENDILEPDLFGEIGKSAFQEAMERHLTVYPLDTEKFVKVNELKPITNPLFFERANMPTKDGLLSNEIFGITKDDRSTIFAYIDLGEEFMHPLLYKTWARLDSSMKNVLCEVENYRYDPEIGKFVPDPKGETGLKYLKKVLTTQHLKKSNSAKRNMKIDFIEKYAEKLFIKKLIVIPAAFRDVDTEGQGNVGVGAINKLYNTIIRDANALKETEDLGITMNGSIRYRIQDTIMKIYNWFIFGRDPVTGQDAQASGLSRKLGLIRRAGMKKSFDWGSRLVICTQNLRKEKLSDIDIKIDEIGIPLAAICANLFPFMMYNIRKWFENNLSDVSALACIDPKTGKLTREYIDDWQMVYSDDRIKKELDRFMHGMSNRFIAVEVPLKTRKKGGTPYLMFKGYNVPDEEAAKKIIDGEGTSSSKNLNTRPLTWCDLIYVAALEAARDKMALVTRFPMDSYWNQFPAKIKVISTIKTVPLLVDNTFYKNYPDISIDEINQNSSNKFIDVALPNNVRLDSIGGDFDGDTISVKIPYSIEANEELRKAVESKIHYISLGGKNKMTTIHEGIQALYQLTMCLPEDEDKMTDPEF